MKKLLFLQNTLLHYRRPLYNQLAQVFDVTVLHSGPQSATSRDQFEEIRTKTLQLGPFFFQSGVLSAVTSKRFDVIIAMNDVRWVNNIIASCIHPKSTSFIWWGGWLTKNEVANWMRLFIVKRSRASIFYSNDILESFASRGIDRRKLFVANNTCDVGVRSKAYLHPNKHRLLFVGSLNKRKENDVLITSFHSILDSIPREIQLTFVGQGPQLAELQGLVHKLNIQDRVSFLGSITDTEELKGLYNDAIAAVSFGQAGLSVLQSFGYGVPFITRLNAISGGETSNIINRVNGLLCDGSMKSLAEMLLGVCKDVEYARELGKNAYDHYTNHCTIEQMAGSFIKAMQCGTAVK